MKNIAILGLALLLAFPVGVSTSFAAIQPQSDKTVKVFVHFKDTPGKSEWGLIRAFGGMVTHSYSIIPAVAADIPESAISGLLHNPNITSIEENHQVEATAITSDEEYSNAWGVERIESGFAHQQNYKGQGVKIGIIDSGINYLHPDLAPNYKGGYDFYYYDLDPMDVYGHGTHVAGTACAADNDNGVVSPKLGVVGVAPECDLYSLRVLNEDGVGYESDIISAIEWSLEREVTLLPWGDTLGTTTQGVRMDVVNLSLGSSQAYSQAGEQTFAAAAAEGLVIVAAAGNSGNPAGKGTNTIYPANYDSVIAVGAIKQGDSRASFSSTGPNVELVAPGESVYSTWNDNQGYYDPQPICRGTLADINGDGQPDGECYKYGSGTSMASPHVAGVAALLIGSGLVHDGNNNGVGDEVRALMQSTAIDLGVAGRDDKYGFGLVNVNNALSAVTPVTPVTPVATGVLDGFVTDELSNPIVGATVTAGMYSTTTNGVGYYLISDIAVGSYTVTANAFGYTAESSGATITENTTTSVNFGLATAPVVDITLATVGYKVKGLMKTDLSWSGATSGNVDVYRNGGIIITTLSDGAYTDNINQKGSGTFTYKICEAGTSVCSNESVVSF
ncbi:MAG: S8 family serine peptidase [Patescibacteria group bacterium]